MQGTGSGSAPPSSPTLQARFKLRLARLRLEEAAAIRREVKEERERDRSFQLSMKNLEVESAFRLCQLELQGSHALGNVTLSSNSNAAFNVSKHVSFPFSVRLR